jgi:hypothetical protein
MSEEFEQNNNPIDDLTQDELAYIKKFYEDNVVNKELLPYNILLNHFLFLKSLNEEEMKEFNQDSNKFFEKKGIKITENPYKPKKEVLKTEVLKFNTDEDREEYWKHRENDKTHDEAIKLLNENQYYLVNQEDNPINIELEY